ncbi:MAG TPA: hypothetical protein VNG93_08860 [Candidatus Dormibacteraeota bacterium]|nr:hypothetical protein [Candidatus Dormibacteraeota bacterium]
MAKAKRRTSNPTTKRPLDETWNEIANDEKAFIGAATKAVERVPAPEDMVDSALLFAARTLTSQREALVPLLEGVTPTPRKGAKPHSSAAVAVSSAYGLAERVVETQRKLLRGLVEAVTPPLTRHAPRPMWACTPLPRTGLPASARSR